MKKYFIIYFLLLVSSNLIFAKKYKWLEDDSLEAIQLRIEQDFSLTIPQGIEKLKSLYPTVDFSDINTYIKKDYLETMNINGVEMMHRKSPGNFKLLYPLLRGVWLGRGSNPEKEDVIMVEEILSRSKGNGNIVCGKRIKYKFSITIPVYDFLIGDTLKVWMPVPIESSRQKNFRLISSSLDNYELSKGSASEHNTIYFEHIIKEQVDDILKFEYIGEFDTYAQYYTPEFILNNIKPYNKNSELYKKYTSLEHKHIICCDSLVKSIIDGESCPFKQSELVYDFISRTYPWAGAREYSTIESLPQYVLDVNHGDCGQVSLLYISMMRSLGIPARWESGWMLHPWSKNLHDWAEVYFEGIGWIPVDVSFGRFVNSKNNQLKNFYSTGMDCYRFATNTGICSPLYPTKKFIRSETVDFQAGEVECSKGNIFYPGWKKSLEVISIQDINKINKTR